MTISIDVINNITILELNDENNNPVSYTAPQTVILTDFYDENEIGAATSLQVAIDNNDADLFIDGVPSDNLDEERRILNGSASFGSSNSINANQVTPAAIVMTTALDNNKPGLTIGPNGGLVIPTDYGGNWAVEWKFTFDFANRSDITGGIDINNTGAILPITVAPTYNTRNATNPAGSAVCGWVPIGSLSVGDEVILKAFRAGTQAGNVPINANETVLTLHYLGT